MGNIALFNAELFRLRKMLRIFNLRGDEMTMDSAASFLLEGVLKLVGAPNSFSCAGLALDLSEAAEKMAARLLAGVNASLEACEFKRGQMPMYVVLMKNDYEKSCSWDLCR